MCLTHTLVLGKSLGRVLINMVRHQSAAIVAINFAACFASVTAIAADAALVEAAKKEQEVVWYTTQIINQFVRPLAAAFEQKYGIKVRYVRANATETAVKILNE